MNKVPGNFQFRVLHSQSASQRFFFRTENHRRLRTVFGALVVFCLALSSVAFAKDNRSYTQVGHNINIGPNRSPTSPALPAASACEARWPAM